jgi:transposase
MEQFIGCDAHKKFSVFASINERGEYGPTVRVGHEREVFRRYLEGLPPNSQIALETSGCYYWMVDAMEEAGHVPRLAHALTAKRRMEGRHKTNDRDARGLAMLLRNGTLPVVWIPPAELRDQREMLRWRMSLPHMRTQVKNRIHAVLQRYNVDIRATDLFGDGGRAGLLERRNELPPHSQQSVMEQLEMLDVLEQQIRECEQRMGELLYPSAERDLLDSLPGVGKVLSAVMALELGDVRRFPGPDRLVSYCGLVPVARESADWKRKDRCPRDCNQYLKWAYVEAGNVISSRRQAPDWKPRHVVQLYERVKEKTKMHGKATMAVARHLAEASFWILTKQQVYQEPRSTRPAVLPVLSSTPG